MAATTVTVPDLGSLTSGQASDLLLATRGTTGYKMLLSDLAKYIMETYNGSTLAGSAQTPKSAIDALNSSIAAGLIGATIPDGTKLLTALCLEQSNNVVKNYIVNSSSLATAVGLPTGYSYCYVVMTKISSNLAEILVYPISSSTNTVPIRNIYTSSGWGGWTNDFNTVVSRIATGDYSDANDLRTVVSHIIIASATTSNNDHVPADGMLVQFRLDSTAIRQVMFTRTDIYLRAYASGSWTSWYQFTGTIVS